MEEIQHMSLEHFMLTFLVQDYSESLHRIMLQRASAGRPLMLCCQIKHAKISTLPGQKLLLLDVSSTNGWTLN